MHESLIYNARPFDHESTETDSMDEHYHVNLHIARNLEENTQALKTMVMDQVSTLIRSVHDGGSIAREHGPEYASALLSRRPDDSPDQLDADLPTRRTCSAQRTH